MWDDTGDEQALGVPCPPSSGQTSTRNFSPWTYHTRSYTAELSPPPPPPPGWLPDKLRKMGAEQNIEHVLPSAELRGGIRGSPRQQKPWEQPRLPDVGAMYGRGSMGPQSFSLETSPGHSGVEAGRRLSLTGFRDLALVKEKYENRCAAGCSDFVERPHDSRGQWGGHSGTGGRGRCLDGAIVQGYCNWLLAEDDTRVRCPSLLLRVRQRAKVSDANVRRAGNICIPVSVNTIHQDINR